MPISYDLSPRLLKLGVAMFDAALSYNYLEEVDVIYRGIQLPQGPYVPLSASLDDPQAPQAADPSAAPNFVPRLVGDARIDILADLLGNTAQFQQLYPASQPTRDFAVALLATYRLQNNEAAIGYVVELVSAGRTHAQAALDVGKAIDSIYAGSDPQILAARALLDNKTEAAAYYAMALTVQQTDLASLRGVVAGISNEPGTVTIAEALVDGSLADNPFALPHLNLYFTPAVQTFTGTAGDDFFTGSVVFEGAAVAASSPFTAGDTVAGGDGKDTLNLVALGLPSGTVALPVASVTGVEIVNLGNVTTQTVTVDASSFPGLQAFNAVRSVGKVAVTGLPAGAVVGVIGDGVVPGWARVQGGDVAFAYAAAAPVVTVSLSGGAWTGAVTNSNASSAVTTAVVTAQGLVASLTGVLDLDGDAVPNQITRLTVNADGELKATLSANDYAPTAALTVTGSRPVDMGTAADFMTIDASGKSGGAGAGGLAIGLGAHTMSFKGSTGADRVTTAAIAAMAAGAIDGGASGFDVLVIRAPSDVDTRAKAAVYTNFETLDLNGVSVDLGLFPGSGYGIRTAGAATVNGWAGGTVNVYGDSALTLNRPAAAAPAVGASLNIEARFDSRAAEAADADQRLTLTAPTAAGVKTLTVTTHQTTTTDFAITSLANLTELTKLDFYGVARSFNIVSGAVAVNPGTVVSMNVPVPTLLDYSASTKNGVTLNGGVNSDVIRGGVNTDILFGGAIDRTDNDTLSAGIQAKGTANQVTGGTGGDLILFTAGENTQFNILSRNFANFSGVDSMSIAALANGYGADTMDTLGAPGGLIQNLLPFVDGIAGTRFTIATGKAATDITFDPEAIVFGVTTVAHGFDFYVRDAGGGVVYVYQDTNGSGTIDDTELGVKLVGTAGAFSAAEFAVVSGNLVYTSA